MNDLVSIIMPSYNTAAYIGKSIESVLNQTYDNWELIIIDDCSTDNTDDVVSVYIDDRIVYLKNEVNSGAAMSRNKALREAKGRWIAFLDSDDLWMPEKLERQIAFMKQHNYSFTYSNYEEINENGKNLGVTVTGPRRISKRGMYCYCWPGCLTVMYDVQKMGIIQINNIKKNNDYAMWLKIVDKSDCFLFNEVLAKYRKREGSISNIKKMDLIKWHYILFRDGLECKMLKSLIYTVVNLLFGCIKKIVFVRRWHR